MTSFATAREEMVRRQIAGRGLHDPALLDAFRSVPREEFVAAALRPAAYQDRPLSIEADQTISQPYIVALMIDAAGVRPGHHVLEVGAGSGYAAAVIGQIAAKVFAIERHGELAALARKRMERLGYSNVTIIEGDGTLGLPTEAPFDAILVAATGRAVPDALVEQLKVGGRLVMPVGAPWSSQWLVRLVKQADGGMAEERLCAVRFVPLVESG